jgi:hypothetical protein
MSSQRRGDAGLYEGVAVDASSQRPPFNSAPAFRLTEPPNPGWKYGEGYEGSAGAEEWKKGEEEGWKTIDTSNASSRYVCRV